MIIYVTYHSKKYSVASENCDQIGTIQNLNTSIDFVRFVLCLYNVK